MERRKTDYSVPEDCWTVGDAVTWIKYRVDPDTLPSPALVEPCENPSQPVETAEQQLEKFREELEELNKVVRIGQLKALGRKNVLSRYQDVHLPREVIPLGTFDERLRFDLSGEGPIRFISSDFLGLYDNPPEYYEICFRIKDVKRVFKKDQVAAAQRRPSETALLAWWKEYLERHSDPDKRPNAQQQHRDAIDYFTARGNARQTEQDMQNLRAHPMTPQERREAGRRPKSP